MTTTKNLLEGRTGPQTQSIEAVKALLTWKGRAVDPLPSVVEFANEGEESRLVLVLSNKKNSYYVTTATKCSCPSQIYRGGACKHMRKFFAERIAKPEARRDEPLIQRGGFKPVSLLPSEEKAAEVA